MDDDDEIQSHPSPASGSPASSPRANGRITVTVAAPAPQTQPAPNSLALALPIQQQPKGNGGGGGGREDCWSEGATAVLIDAWGERYLELSRGNLKQKHWKEVAEIVSGREDYTKAPKTDIQCKNRIDTVKKKYKSEKAKIAAGATSKWPFFERLDQLIGPTAKIPGAAGTSAVGNSNLPLQKVPLAIPVGGRGGANQFHPQKQQQQQPQQVQLKNQKIQFRRRAPPVDSDSSEREPPSPVSSDSFPPESYERKRPRVMNSNAVKGKEGGKKGKGWGSAVRELTQAILKFGEAYEQAESSKLQQVVEMEKQRMKFAKDLELQRMQFFMKTQLEISQLKLERKGGNPSNHHSTTTPNNNNNNHHNNNSDSE
ncbi:trihelix transcription factor ASIL2-like [Abrus precatorius]|uniref:Trihelix transcription factor ASIL2-like n=1 Tax=Abrus precatorius TaxID=3816 RepID=A0A8B8JXP7_ABRPR|nr:trihelix transcription factor ASIL2-like [Abrus precatorius]